MEKEIKLLNIDSQPLIERLESLGAAKVYEGTRVITHFDTQDAFWAKQGKQIKITEEGAFKLTVTSGVGSGNPQEHKTKVGDNIQVLLLELGLVPISVATAPRVSYEWKDIDFDIDYYPRIPSVPRN